MSSFLLPSFPGYFVDFFEDTIVATVTDAASVVGQWLSFIQRIHHRRLHKLVVGLDIEWRPNSIRGVTNPVAILQLCVGRRCLIFQILHCDHIPRCLFSFLNNPNNTFVGVGITRDVNSLLQDYGLQVSCTMDLSVLAAEKLDDETLRRAGLKRLALEVLDKEIEKPESIARSNWDNFELSDDQVHYACIDAFLSFEIGRTLIFEYY